MNEFVLQISFASYFEHPDIYKECEDVQTFELQDKVLFNLQQINFFIGENNSGKSRFIRTVMKWCKYLHCFELPEIINDKIEAAQTRTRHATYQFWSEKDVTLNRFKAAHNNLHSRKGSKYVAEGNIPVNINSLIELVKEAGFWLSDDKIKQLEDKIINSSKKSLPSQKQELAFYKDVKNFANSFKKLLYIPLLRGAKLLGGDFYLDRTIKDYNFEKNEVFTGLSIYEDLKTHLLGSYEERELIKGFETLLSEHFFDNQTVTLIPKINADYVIVRIGNVEHPLHDLGDGIQALIVLLFPLYMRKNEDYFIFIEEPEMHLYPKWQRLFIKIIKKEFPKHQFFITTHSNVFINTADTSVYQVTRSSDKSEVKHIIGNDKRGILADLGYQPSDILHANFIIWVEGISDKIYIKKFLELYDENLKEGEDYTIMFYGGCGNLKHILVNDAKNPTKVSINQLNSNFGFIIDSDRPNANPTDADWGSEKSAFDQKEEVASICNQNNKFCWITQKRELENHISLTLWKNAFDTLQKEKNGENTPNLLAVNGETETMKYDWDYDNRFSAKNKSKPYLDPAPSDKKKIEMAEQVIKIITKSDLESDTDLHNAMTDLVNAIKAANK